MEISPVLCLTRVFSGIPFFTSDVVTKTGTGKQKSALTNITVVLKEGRERTLFFFKGKCWKIFQFFNANIKIKAICLWRISFK